MKERLPYSPLWYPCMVTLLLLALIRYPSLATPILPDYPLRRPSLGLNKAAAGSIAFLLVTDPAPVERLACWL